MKKKGGDDMSIQSILLRRGAGKSDRQRDSVIPFPAGVRERCNLSYGPYGKANLLDVYWPEGADLCPVIVNVHGGGYVYGNKEVYKRYCMDLARRGFTVVNINYRLAPRWKFPAPLEDIHNAMVWLAEQGEAYHADTDKLFMVGDSAGAQLVSQYAAMVTNPAYMTLFGPYKPGPGPMRLRAIGLNCGMYDAVQQAAPPRKGIAKDYLGRRLTADDPRLQVLDAIGENYPAAHITTACHDFLRPCASPMYDLLTSRGIDCRMDVYGSEEDPTIGHVFHINILQPQAISCNDDQCNFFRRYL